MQIQMRVAVTVAPDLREQQRATEFAPETGDEVAVAFAHGDPRFPYVTGLLWNDKDTPPPTPAEDEGSSHHRVPR
jgi:uncharacterized protein involved in type VI secretion and phage assembly